VLGAKVRTAKGLVDSLTYGFRTFLTKRHRASASRHILQLLPDGQREGKKNRQYS
jgi:hypothetical protein